MIMGNPEEVYKSPSHPFDSLDLLFFKNARLEEFQVYNVKEDPGQQTDLYKENPSSYSDLKSKLLQYHQEVVKEGPVWEGLPAK